MIFKNVSFFLCTLLILLSVSKRLCQPKIILQTLQSIADNMTNISIPRRLILRCTRCRKFLNHDLTTRKISEEFKTNNATILLDNINNTNYHNVNGHLDTHAVPNSEKFEILRSKNLILRTSTEISEVISQSGDALSEENSWNERSRKDNLRIAKSSNPKRVGSFSGASSIKNKTLEKESHLEGLGSESSLINKNFDLSRIAMILYPKKHNNKLEMFNFKPFGYTASLKMGHESSSPMLSLNSKNTSKSQVQNYPQIDAIGESSVINEKTTNTQFIKDIYERFSKENHRVIRSLKDSRHRNYDWNEKNKKSDIPKIRRYITSSEETLDVSGNIEDISNLQRFATNVNGAIIENNFEVPESENSKKQTSEVVTNVNGAIIVDRFEVSEIVNSRKESPEVVTNVNGAIIENEVPESENSKKQTSEVVTNVNGAIIEDNSEVSEIVNLRKESPEVVTSVNGVTIENNFEVPESENSKKQSSEVVTNVNGAIIEGNFEVSEKVTIKKETPEVMTNVNDAIIEGNFEISEGVDLTEVSPHVVTNVNGAIIEPNFKVSVGADSKTESSQVVTNVNGAIIEEHFGVSEDVDLKRELHVEEKLNAGKIKGNLEHFGSSDSTTAPQNKFTTLNASVIGKSLKGLKSNKTLNIFEEDLAEECMKGSGSCLECSAISPYCHYNHRGKLCFYADVKHGNSIYECGVRFFSTDSYTPFFVCLAILVSVSCVVLYFLARAFYRKILTRDAVTNIEVENVRNVVHLIREKRSM